MAKVKTAKQLQEEAKKVIEEAKKIQKELLKKAKEIEKESKVELAQKCLEFLKGETTKEELIDFAKKVSLLFDEEIENKKESSGDENENEVHGFSDENENQKDGIDEKSFSHNY